MTPQRLQEIKFHLHNIPFGTAEISVIDSDKYQFTLNGTSYEFKTDCPELVELLRDLTFVTKQDLEDLIKK